MSLLTVRNLRVEFGTPGQGMLAPGAVSGVLAVDGLDLNVEAGERVGIVGESGSGKSVSMLALMGLVAASGRVSADQLSFAGHDLLRLPARQRRGIIGKEISMVFQDATGSLNPSYTIGFQLFEPLRIHLGLRGDAVKQRALELLELVEMPAARSRLDAYPHQLSGGMNQRVMIAMALACNPKLLIADEPTTALDLTVQAQILDLLLSLQKQRQMALLLITHDLSVVAEATDRVLVMYAGMVMEESPTEQLFSHPRHPYTQALLAAIPEHNKGAARLAALPGVVPGRDDRPPGCLLEPRCRYAEAACADGPPKMIDGVRCIKPL